MNCIESLRYKTDKQKFVIKTYSICAVQIAMTVAACAYVLSSKPAQEWIREHFYLHYASLFLGIVIFCVIGCCKKPARKVPLNYILLFTFTALWSYMVAGLVQFFPPENVLIVAAFVLAMWIALTIYAVCAKDSQINYCYAVGSVLSIAVFPLILFSWIYREVWFYNLLYVLIVVLTAIYIVYDTKMIMEQLETDEYITGAIMLYVDLI